MLPSDDLSAETLVGSCSGMKAREVNRTHLEHFVEVALIRLEVFDSHRAPQVFSVADF